MPSAFLDTVVSIALPASLFVGSLWRISAQARSARSRHIGDILWLGCSVIVNVVACFWLARMLNTVRLNGHVPEALASYTYSAGTYLFLVLALVLTAPLLHTFVQHLVRRWRRGGTR